MTHVGMLIDFALRKFHFAFDHDKISFTNESSIVESSPICYTDFLSFFEDNDRITPDLSHLNAQQRESRGEHERTRSLRCVWAKGHDF